MDYSIPASIKYNTPIYIHSHPTELPIENFFMQNLEPRIQLLEQDMIQTITTIYNYLRNISTSSEVMSFYMNTHNSQGRRLNNNTNVQNIINSFKDAKSKLQNLAKIQSENNVSKQVNNAVENFWSNFLQQQAEQGTSIGNALGNIMGQEIVDFFKQEAQFQGRSKKYKSLTIQDPVSKLLNSNQNKITKEFQRILKKFFHQLNAWAPQVNQVTDTLRNDVDSFINNYNAIQASLFQELGGVGIDHRIKAFNDHSIAQLAVSGAGSSFEKVFNYIILTNVLQQNGDVILNSVNGQKQYKVDGYSAASTGHGVTTDNIITLLDNATKKLTTIGFSLKANASNNFSKTVTPSSEIKHIYDMYLAPLSAQEANELLYYLGNEEASNIYLAPYTYDRVIPNIWSNSFVIPPSHNRSNRRYDYLTRIRQALSFAFFVKGMLGSIFLKPDFEQAIKQQGYVPPILLSFLDNDYFTYKILEKILLILKRGVGGISKYTTNTKVRALNFGITESSLKELFVTKKMVEKISANKYENLLNGKVSPIYSQIAPYMTINAALTAAAPDLKYESFVQQILKPIKFNMTISDII